jgi:hypothetical protein
MEASMSSQPDKNSRANEAMCEVARIARVPEATQTAFVRLLGSAIKRAHSDSSRPGGKNISASALTRDFFDPIVRASKKLRVELEGLQGEHRAVEEAARSMAASHFFSEALLNVLPDADFVDPIGHLIDSLNLGLVIEAAERASARAKSWLTKSGRKKGTGRPAFDMFVMALLVASQQTAGRLTIYRRSYGNERWAGSLPKALEQLQSLLPQSNFSPAGKPGHSLYSVYQRWRSEAGKSRRKKG